MHKIITHTFENPRKIVWVQKIKGFVLLEEKNLWLIEMSSLKVYKLLENILIVDMALNSLDALFVSFSKHTDVFVFTDNKLIAQDRVSLSATLFPVSQPNGIGIVNEDGVIIYSDIHSSEFVFYRAEAITAVSTNLDKSQVAVVTDYGVLKIWNTYTNTLLQNFTLPEPHNLSKLTLSHDGQLVAILGPLKTPIYDVNKRDVIISLNHLALIRTSKIKVPANDVAFIVDKSLLVSGGIGGLWIWNTNSWKLQKYIHIDGNIRQIVTSTNSEYTACITTDYKVHIFKVKY